MSKTYKEIQDLINEKKEFDFFDYFFAVMGSEKNNANLNMYGTCSYIGNNNYITAGHCLKNIDESKTKFIHVQNESGSRNIDIIDYEIFKKLDICIFQTNETPDNVKWFKWSVEVPSIFTDVFACGFPHGFDIKKKTLYSRGFKGSISGINQNDIFIKNSFFTALETSFSCPKGISGAPLINFGDHNFIYGIVVGNTKVSMITNEYREYTESKNETFLYTTEETTTLGLAVSSINILKQKSRILDDTMKNYLEKEDLLFNEGNK